MKERGASEQRTLNRRMLLSQGLRAEHVPVLLADPIAITAMSCRFPGGATSPEKFWELLHSERDPIRPVPRERWDPDAHYNPDPAAVGKMYTRQAGFIEDASLFDPAAFGISPREAHQIDPQQRILLELTWEALDRAGEPRRLLAGSPTGVFIGNCGSDYALLQSAQLSTIDAYSGTGGRNSILANRISYLLNLTGPSLVVDTACSSSLVALHLACQSLRLGEIERAIVGGINLILAPYMHVLFSKARILSADGRCKTFAEGADGYVRSEGCGVLILKRLSDALVNGDPIVAVVRGTASNQDGRTNGLSAPSRAAQEAVIRQALDNAGIAPDEVGFVETHGTGTAVGDSIEYEALARVYGVQSERTDSPCVLGTLKSHIGHLEAASGIAGVIKSALCLSHRSIPANPRVDSVNPAIVLLGTRFVLAQAATDWQPDGAGGERTRYAGVSSFGFGGSNAHVILGEAPGRDAMPRGAMPELHVLPLSAHGPGSLRAQIDAYRERLAAPDLQTETALYDFCSTASTRRDHRELRVAVCGRDAAELASALGAAAEAASDEVLRERRVLDGSSRIAAVFSGQGQQSFAMGRKLYQTHEAFRETVDACDAELRELAGWSVREELLAEEPRSRLMETEFAQPAIFVVQAALLEVWRSFGIEPDAVVGHSVGEVAAAHAAGVLSRKDALRVIWQRGRLMQRATGLGKMAEVELTPGEARRAISGYDGRLDVAAVNAPDTVVLSGEEPALREVLAELARRRVHTRMLPVAYAFHSPQMESFREELVGLLGGICPRAPDRLLISTVSGAAVSAADYGASYWGRNIREAVRFADAIAALITRGYGAFIEISAHPVLSESIARGMRQRKHRGVVVGSLHRHKDDERSLLTGLARLYEAGLDVDFTRLYPSGQCVDLPAYCYERQEFWFDQGLSAGRSKTRRLGAEPSGPSGHPLLGSALELPTVRGGRQYIWEIQLSADGFFAVRDHQVRDTVIFPAAGYVDLVLSAAAQVRPELAPVLTDVSFEQALDLASESGQSGEPGASATAGRTVLLILVAENDQPLVFRFIRGDSETASEVLMSGTLRVAAAQESPCTAGIAERRDACTEEVDADSHYEGLALEGLRYGPAYRGVHKLWRRDWEVVGELRLTEAAEREGGRCTLHPSVLDACFQAVSAALPSRLRMETYLPVRLGRLRRFSSPTRVCFVHAVAREVTADGSVLAADLRLFDEEGRAILEVEDYQGQRLRPRSTTALDHAYRIAWHAVAVSGSADGFALNFAQQGRWILLADRKGVAGSLAALLEERGEICERIYEHEVEPQFPDGLRARFAQLASGSDRPLRGVLLLWTLDDPPVNLDQMTGESAAAQERGLVRALHVLQALATAPFAAAPRLWLVTRAVHTLGVPAADLAHAALWGLGRVAAMELPRLRTTLVDLHATDSAAVQALFREIAADVPEDQVLLRAQTRYVARLVRIEAEALRGGTAISQPAAGRPYRLKTDRSGVLDHLVLVEMERRSPGPGEVEIEVRAAGLNFLDVLQALGTIPDDLQGPGADKESGSERAGPRLGGEFSGRVVSVGTGVQGLSPGQRVVGLGFGCHASFITTRAELVMPAPEGLSDLEAATLPIVFLTAWYSLVHIGRLQRGQRVLIHAGAGGVGLAAIQIAQHLGAEVYATAGTPEKRELLRSLGVLHVADSRSLEFAAEIRQATGGEGVDVVLNSLAGEFIPRSLDLLRPYGRFVEIGKRDYYENRPLRLRPFLRNLSFALVDLRGMTIERPDHVQSLFLELLPLFDARVLRPLPHRVFPMSQASEAFRFMAQGQHTGKILLALGEEGAHILPLMGLRLRADARYLITGGLGGLGLAVAQRLAERGARHLALLGRSAPTEQAQEKIASLARQGVDVRVLSADVGSERELAAALAQLDAEPQPLRGIVHAAGVLDDGMLVNQSAARFARVLAPKLHGGFALHALTRDRELDFFVMFSSAAALLGSPGQASYAAGNAFLDSLAEARQQVGLAGLSIRWGAWSEVGMAAQAQRWQRLARSGAGSLSPAQGLATLEVLMQAAERAPLDPIAILPIDWQLWRQASPQARDLPLFADLLTAENAGMPRAGSSDARQVILDAPEPERPERMLSFVIKQVALLLRAASSQIDPKRSFSELGFDSLMGVELRNRIELTLGVAISIEGIVQGRQGGQDGSCERLASYLLEQLGPQSVREPVTRTTGPPPADPGELTDAQVTAMLEQLLTEGSR